MSYNVQRSAKVGAPGLVNFITAVAFHSALACLQHSRNLVHRLWPVSVPSWGNTRVPLSFSPWLLFILVGAAFPVVSIYFEFGLVVWKNSTPKL